MLREVLALCEFWLFRIKLCEHLCAGSVWTRVRALGSVPRAAAAGSRGGSVCFCKNPPSCLQSSRARVCPPGHEKALLRVPPAPSVAGVVDFGHPNGSKWLLVLICVSLTAGDMERLFGHLPYLVFLRVLGPSVDWVAYFLIGYSLQIFSLCGSSSPPLAGVCPRAENFNFNEIYLFNCSMRHAFDVSKSHPLPEVT